MLDASRLRRPAARRRLRRHRRGTAGRADAGGRWWRRSATSAHAAGVPCHAVVGRNELDAAAATALGLPVRAGGLDAGQARRRQLPARARLAVGRLGAARDSIHSCERERDHHERGDDDARNGEPDQAQLRLRERGPLVRVLVGGLRLEVGQAVTKELGRASEDRRDVPRVDEPAPAAPDDVALTAIGPRRVSLRAWRSGSKPTRSAYV